MPQLWVVLYSERPVKEHLAVMFWHMFFLMSAICLRAEKAVVLEALLAAATGRDLEVILTVILGKDTESVMHSLLF